jgi:hypothetical protein
MEELIKTLRNRMQNGTVRFSYTKLDGTLRTATGTTKLEMIPEEYHPKDAGMNTPEVIQRYFDIDKNGWRSFTKTNLVSIDD